MPDRIRTARLSKAERRPKSVDDYIKEIQRWTRALVTHLEMQVEIEREKNQSLRDEIQRLKSKR